MVKPMASKPMTVGSTPTTFAKLQRSVPVAQMAHNHFVAGSIPASVT